MANRRFELDNCFSLTEKDYLRLIEDHILVNALHKAGLKKMPEYKVAESILRNGHIEIHINPVI